MAKRTRRTFTPEQRANAVAAYKACEAAEVGFHLGLPERHESIPVPFQALCLYHSTTHRDAIYARRRPLPPVIGLVFLFSSYRVIDTFAKQVLR